MCLSASCQGYTRPVSPSLILGYVVSVRTLLYKIIISKFGSLYMLIGCICLLFLCTVLFSVCMPVCHNIQYIVFWTFTVNFKVKLCRDSCFSLVQNCFVSSIHFASLCILKWIFQFLQKCCWDSGLHACTASIPIHGVPSPAPSFNFWGDGFAT